MAKDSNKKTFYDEPWGKTKVVAGWALPAEEDHLVSHLERTGLYQKQHRDNALRYVKRFGVAIDVGAHVGLWLKDLTEVFQYVHAFEPIKVLRKCLIQNVKAQNYTLYPYALGVEERIVSMSWNPENTGNTHVNPDVRGTNNLVNMKTLDSFAFPSVDYIKLDCEGYEVYAAMGGRETIVRCRPTISVEQKPHPFYQELNQYSAVEFLQSLGMIQVSRVSDDIVMAWPD